MPSPIAGLHAMIYSSDPDATRAFLRDTLGLPFVDAGHGWLIFGLPPAEIGVHPNEEDEDDGDAVSPGATAPRPRHELYFMCPDIHKAVADLSAKGVRFISPIADRGWGVLTSFDCPGAGEMYLYQPRHPTAISMTGSTSQGNKCGGDQQGGIR